ncbi:phosphoribosylanthranilate isomerase [Synoicihabitans lomoniglobus]|uniref:N-(5'-phosphoribosyl)anthranilate isomerase n=1 Tax=Synoicihabitans lomoniglobus TaxID=2909285 RepID=A0AAF0CRX5_9BACT|nr:phosphoribosylanthranilate isomerase [Opitutaceae bacterium LMO-M01]WED66907.1 phosphoribosylanthranilate isomerase [Opitutaceae bacterium LMO-M01]
MIDGIRLKFCGLTTLVDAEFADRLGADYLGFILYPKSPRYLPLRQYRDMATALPDGRKHVAVMVEPDEAELVAARDAGFDRFQIHFRTTTPEARLRVWSETVGKDVLWLAPKLPADEAVAAAVLEAAGTVLLDTFHRDRFGGSGQTGDWGRFRELRASHPDHTWILAGGLSPENVVLALAESGTNFVDVNSGVETAPGMKDHAKMQALVLAIHRARTAN